MDAISLRTDAAVPRNDIGHSLGVAFYPGTELMTSDVEHPEHSRVLIPRPSNDPNDPVNWSRTWKWLTMSSMALTAFNWTFSPTSLAPQVPFYVKDFESTLPQVINFIGVSLLVLGFTNLIWIPLTRGFGRRPVAILTTLITTASCIWRAKATTYNSFLGAAIVCGLGASPGETLGPVLVADVVFLHERGWWMGIYQWAFWSGLMIGPILAGVTADSYGWRSFWWLSTAISAFTTVWIIFFLPETKWDRRECRPNALTSSSHGESIPRNDEKLEAEIRKDTVMAAQTCQTEASALATAQCNLERSAKPSCRQFLPIVGWNSHDPVFGAIILPFKLVRLPIVLWGAFQFTFSASGFLMLNIVQSQALGAPPFNFSAAAVGYSNLALFAGTSISLLTAGPLSDAISRRATLRNGGIREPEMRLAALIPFVACFLVGCIVVSVGFQYGWPWEAVIIVGFTLVGIQVAAISGIAINYVVDCYKPVSGEFLVIATVIKNVWGYGMTKFLNTWIVQMGYIAPLMTIMALNVATLLLGALPLYFYGKKLRGWSAASSVHKAS